MGPELIRRIINTPQLTAWNGSTKKWVLFSDADEKIVQVDELSRYGLDQNRADTPQPFLYALGSIFHRIKGPGFVWGTGINPVWQRAKASAENIDICAVRGPLTQRYIKEILGIPAPKVFGDPALLLPQFFPEFQKSKTPNHSYSVFLQHNDECCIKENTRDFGNHEFLLWQRVDGRPWRETIRRILESEYVISSSLHAIICAEAFGIPARWWHTPELPSSHTEHPFKFNDYYLSTGRKPNQFCETIEEALDIGPNEPIREFNHELLLQSFPRNSIGTH